MKNSKNTNRALRLALTLLVVASPLAFADEASDRGLEIAQQADKEDTGWGDNTVVSTMTLRNRHGQTSERKLEQRNLEISEDGAGDKSIVVFKTPRDIEGTALLSHTKVLEPDDQWLFLPALGRVKRISSANKSGPFVGSEFAYEDLLSQEVGKYTYKFEKEDTFNGVECYLVERVPQYENSGYSKQRIWWDKEEYRPQQIEFYDRKNTLLKTLTYSGYNSYLTDYWRPTTLKMVNHQTGKSTDLVFENWQFNTGLKDSDFTSSRLKRVR